MNLRIIIIISILFLLWIYLLSVFKRGKLESFRFILGSIGTFLILFIFSNIFRTKFVELFSTLLSIIGNFTGFFESYSKYGMLFINHNNTVISLYIDMECSGLLEMIIFTSTLIFFPVYKGFQKLKTIITGIVFIILANYIRIISILLLIYQFGSNLVLNLFGNLIEIPVYTIAHSIIGRFIFYLIIIVLYYNIFTKKQILSQKVGKFTYNNDFIQKETKGEEDNEGTK